MMLTLPRASAGKPHPLTPLRKWMALALVLQGSVTDFGMVGGILPFGPLSMTAFLVVSLLGSTSRNGTLLNTLGFQSGKINRSRFPPASKNISFVVMTVAILSSGIGTYLPF